jgi:hypothetical protein
MEIINLGSSEGLPPLDWDLIVAKLDAKSAPPVGAINARTTWLATINDDGSAHVTAVGALWVDGRFWFQTGATRKGRNLARDPRCSIAISVQDADVVVEGDAVRVTEPEALTRIAKAWADDGWPAEPDPGSPHRSTLRLREHRRGTCTGAPAPLGDRRLIRGARRINPLRVLTDHPLTPRKNRLTSTGVRVTAPLRGGVGHLPPSN